MFVACNVTQTCCRVPEPVNATRFTLHANKSNVKTCLCSRALNKHFHLNPEDLHELEERPWPDRLADDDGDAGLVKVGGDKVHDLKQVKVGINGVLHRVQASYILMSLNMLSSSLNTRMHANKHMHACTHMQTCMHEDNAKYTAS